MGTMNQKFKPLTDAEFQQLQEQRADLLRRLTVLTEEFDELSQRYNAEVDRRSSHPGAEVREFRPRPSNGGRDGE